MPFSSEDKKKKNIQASTAEKCNPQYKSEKQNDHKNQSSNTTQFLHYRREVTLFGEKYIIVEILSEIVVHVQHFGKIIASWRYHLF